jgi:O-antigen/teichoic acid export membrane protein
MAAERVPAGPLRSLGRHTLIYGSGYVATAAVSLILVPVFTHAFTPSEYGLLALMLVFYGLGKQVYDLGFTNSVARFYFDESADHAAALRQMQATSLAFLTLYAGTLTASLWIFSTHWSHLLTGSDGHGDLIRIVSLTLLAETLSIVPLTVIRMQERSGLFVAMTLLRLVSSLGLSILFVVVMDWGVRGALLANTIPAGVILVVLLLLEAGNLRAWPSESLLRQMLAFGLPFFPVLLCGWVIDAADRYLLQVFTTRAEVGFYSLGYRFAQVMQLGVAAFMMGWAPLRYRIYEQPDAKAVYRRLTTSYVVVASLPAVGLALFADELVDVVAPPSYAPAADVIPLLVLAYTLQGVYYLMLTGMGVTKRTAPLVWIAALGAAANIGINLLVIPAFGMKGAAATTVLAYAIMIAGSWYASQRVYPISYDWRRMGQVTALAVAVVVASNVIAPSGLAAQSLCGLGAWLVYIALLIRTHAVDKGEVDKARGLARSWVLRVRHLLARTG